MSRKSLDYSSIKWDQFFKYSDKSPSGLVTLDNKPVGYKAYQNKDSSPKGWRVGFNYKNYSVHRIIWCLFNSHIKSEQDINHIDHNPFNNCINNLECVTIKENQRRKKLHIRGCVGKNNSSGITGVREEIKNAKTHPKYYATASWVDMFGKAKSKSIPYNGNKELAWDLAELVREEAIDLINRYGQTYRQGV